MGSVACPLKNVVFYMGSVACLILSYLQSEVNWCTREQAGTAGDAQGSDSEGSGVQDAVMPAHSRAPTRDTSIRSSHAVSNLGDSPLVKPIGSVESSQHTRPAGLVATAQKVRVPVQSTPKPVGGPASMPSASSSCRVTSPLAVLGTVFARVPGHT